MSPPLYADDLHEDFNALAGMDMAKVLKLQFFLSIYSGNIEFVKSTITVFPEAVTWRDDLENTALMLCSVAKQEQPDIAAYLLEKNAEIDAQKGNGATALSLAVRNGYLATVLLLTGAGAALNGLQNTTHAAWTGADGHNLFAAGKATSLHWEMLKVLRREELVRFQARNGMPQA